MKTHKKTKQYILSLFTVTLFLISCGQGTNLEMLPKKSTTKKTTTESGSITGGNTQTTNTASTTNQTQAKADTTKTMDSASCIANRQKMTNLGYCKGILQEYASYNSAVSKCSSAVPYLSKTACNEVDSSIKSFAESCSGVIVSSEIISTISTEAPDCYKAIQALK